MAPSRGAWGGFSAWAAAGAFFCFCVLAAASIGLFLLPVVLLAILGLAATPRPWPQVAGFLSGLGTLAVVIGLLSLDYEFTSGPYFVVSGALIVAGLAAFLALTDG